VTTGLEGGGARLVLRGSRRMLSVPAAAAGFAGTVVEEEGGAVRIVEPTPAAAARLRELVPGLRPRPLGAGCSSFGFGDRLGLATPGHVRALRAARSSLAPVLAQQSARELERTGRSFEVVLEAATWGALEAGWDSGYGADADHLRTEGEVERALAAGFTMLTLDPSAHIDRAAGAASGADLERRLDALPWEALEDDRAALRRRHSTGAELDLARAAATFGRAFAHLVSLWRAIERAGTGPVDVEVSVDETDRPTTPFEHAFLALELERLGVRFTSLALRFPGRWEKGVDLIGDLGEVATALDAHALIAAESGGYKLSVHSGSDKHSLYPLLAERADVSWHVKTSGTSYLEALRVVAASDPALFRAILALARQHVEADRRSYAIAPTAGVPGTAALAEADLPSLLDDPDVRQGLHVTFGTVLSDADVGPRLHEVLESASEEYAQALERHFLLHLDPLEILG
jgi:tagaturonate epimerase